MAEGLHDGHVVFVVEVLIIVQYSVLVVRSGYTRNIVADQEVDQRGQRLCNKTVKHIN